MGVGSGTAGGFGETSKDDTPDEDDGAEWWSSGFGFEAYGSSDDMEDVDVREKRDAEVDADGGPDESDEL